jgi:ParB family transcriptional regulator, chromosome partitioning protein
MRDVVCVSPFRCRMWELHDRIEANITEETCRSEIASFSVHGQLVPVLGRRIKSNPDYEVELIYGARRLFVARHLNIPLAVELRDISDRDAIVAMDAENRLRMDVSPYERGVAYAAWLRAGHFRSQQDLSKTLKVSESTICRLLQLARLPSVVVNAFGRPQEICEAWGLTLSEKLGEPMQRSRIIDTARAIAKSQPRPLGPLVYSRLLSAAAKGKPVRMSERDEIVNDKSGKPIFKVCYHRSAVSFVVPLELVSGDVLRKLRAVITKALSHTEEDGRDIYATSPMCSDDGSNGVDLGRTGVQPRHGTSGSAGSSGNSGYPEQPGV